MILKNLSQAETELTPTSAEVPAETIITAPEAQIVPATAPVELPPIAPAKVNLTPLYLIAGVLLFL